MEQEKQIKQPKIIVVAGIERSGSSFLLKAIESIIKLSGLTCQTTENLTRGEYKKNWIVDGIDVPELSELTLKNDVDFILVRVLDFSIELEAKASLVYVSTRDHEEIINSMATASNYNLKECVKGFETLVKWMRSGKLAYCMDFNSPMNLKGLHNYQNLRNIILPMNYCFRPLNFFKNKEGKEISPQQLIEEIVPILKEKSKEAKEKFDNKIEEIKNEKEGNNVEEN